MNWSPMARSTFCFKDPFTREFRIGCSRILLCGIGLFERAENQDARRLVEHLRMILKPLFDDSHRLLKADSRWYLIFGLAWVCLRKASDVTHQIHAIEQITARHMRVKGCLAQAQKCVS